MEDVAGGFKYSSSLEQFKFIPKARRLALQINNAFRF